MLSLLVSAAVAAAAPTPSNLSDIRQAIVAGRLDQAKSMLSAAISKGAAGEPVDRLLADLAFASGNSAEALARYSKILAHHPDDSELLERAAIAALRSRAVDQARPFSERAANAPRASWRAWNALGVIADLQGDFETSDKAYERALAISPGRPEVLNNYGWSRLLRGDWEGAVTLLEDAASKLPQSARAANNLELARAALAAELPERRRGENDEAWAVRLNDAGVAAHLRGDRQRAIAAFARAIAVHGSWYRRAANNLDAVNGGK